MGPLFFRAENRRSSSMLSATICRFNGAALFQSGERLNVTPRQVGHLALQWGRSFSERRTLPTQHHSPRLRSTASMGPLFFRAENGHRWEVGPPNDSASMGPLFFRAENVDLWPIATFSPTPLQWGRSFSERRTRPLARGHARGQSLQWGRSFSERRTHATDRRAGWDKAGASMGPLFFRAENVVTTRKGCGSGLASMGPFFFRAENARGDGGADRRIGASMGPLFFRAENTPRTK